MSRRKEIEAILEEACALGYVEVKQSDKDMEEKIREIAIKWTQMLVGDGYTPEGIDMQIVCDYFENAIKDFIQAR